MMHKNKITDFLSANKVDMLLVTDEANMRYLSGFTGEGYLLITKDRGVVVTDLRYTVAAKQECPELEIYEWNKKGYYRAAMDAVKSPDIKTVGYEDMYLTVTGFRAFEKKLQRNAKLKPLGKSLDELRQIKDDNEISLVREAEAIGDRAFARLMLDLGVPSGKLGTVGKQVSEYHIPTPVTATEVTERQIAARLEYYLKDEGGERLSFDTIAASGLNGAKPHAVPEDKRLQNGELLTLDFGCVYKGYCSDMTRTIAIGEPGKDLVKIYDIVREAQEKALNGIRPGMTGMEIDALARDYIKDKGYGKYFGHSLGHSVGLKIHEIPGFSQKEKTVIRPGMIVSVEPGIYIPDVGGVRIEDLVVITDTGIDDLSDSTKELLIV